MIEIKTHVIESFTELYIPHVLSRTRIICQLYTGKDDKEYKL